MDNLHVVYCGKRQSASEIQANADERGDSSKKKTYTKNSLQMPASTIKATIISAIMCADCSVIKTLLSRYSTFRSTLLLLYHIGTVFSRKC